MYVLTYVCTRFSVFIQVSINKRIPSRPNSEGCAQRKYVCMLYINTNHMFLCVDISPHVTNYLQHLNMYVHLYKMYYHPRHTSHISTAPSHANCGHHHCDICYTPSSSLHVVALVVIQTTWVCVGCHARIAQYLEQQK